MKNDCSFSLFVLSEFLYSTLRFVAYLLVIFLLNINIKNFAKIFSKSSFPT